MTRALLGVASLIYVGVSVLFAPYVYDLFRGEGWAAILPTILYSLGSVTCVLLMYLSPRRRGALLHASLASLIPPAAQTVAYVEQTNQVHGAVFLPAIATALLFVTASTYWIATHNERSTR